MTDDMRKTKSQLVVELANLQQHIAKTEAAIAQQPDSAEMRLASHLSLVRNAAYGIYVTSVEDRFITVNPALVEMLGYESVADLMSIKLSDLYEQPEAHERLIDTHTKTPSVLKVSRFAG